MGALALVIIVYLTARYHGGSVAEKVAKSHARYDAPAMWKVTDKDSTIYLFGTVHLLPEGMKWQKRDMLDAFSQVGTVFFEVPDNDKSRLKETMLTRKYGLYNAGESLRTRLDGADINRLTAAAYNVDIPINNLDNFKPWLVADLLVVAAAEKAGLSSENSADNWFRKKAKTDGKAIKFLDSVETYFEAVAKQPEKVQLKALKYAMTDFESLAQDMKKINSAWKVGRIDSLYTNLLQPAQERAPEIYKALFTDRNAKWAKTLHEFMQGSENAMVVVGIGHLIGEDGLPTRLEDMGYKVERVERKDLPNE